MNNKILLKSDNIHLKEINEHTIKFFKSVIEIGNLLDREMVITSANDGTHGGSTGSNSLHYKNRAWDLRIHHLSNPEKMTLQQYLRDELGSAWDVVLENLGMVGEHCHVEKDNRP